MGARNHDWPGHNATLRLRGGMQARYLNQCEITGRRRVQTFKFRGCHMPVPKTPDEVNGYVPTTWLLNDAGQCRGDLAPCEQDWLGEVLPEIGGAA